MLYASAIGVYNAYINGKKAGCELMTPGWTDYRSRVQYQSYEVTDLLEQNNELTLGVADGWAVGTIGGVNMRCNYSDRPMVIAELRIEYTDGSEESIATDESFDIYSSAVTFSDIYDGESVDLTHTPVYLGRAVVGEYGGVLCAAEGERITEQETVYPVELITTPTGERVIDFGQNMTGFVRVKIRAPRGSKITFTHAEVLDKEGNFYNENYRSAKTTASYIASGGDDELFPSYTFYGFRYIKLIEYPFDEIDVNHFRAVQVNSEIRRTGSYLSGNAKINQLYHNIVWGQKSNYLDIPTDCPQRDERLGWTGDAQVFCRTAAINYDVEKFFEKWLTDMRCEQLARGGAVGAIVPAPRAGYCGVSTAWGDAACIIPWQLYLAYGNVGLLMKNFPLMRDWVDYLHRSGSEEYLWLGGTHYGDWLAMDADADGLLGATSNDLIASAFFAYSTELLIKAGEVIGEDVRKYKILHSNIKKRFREYFMEGGMPKQILPHTEEAAKDGKPIRDLHRRGVTQTALVLILHFGLATEEERPRLADKLVELIRDAGDRMLTGFVGTPYILHVLSDNGYTDLAYKLLFNEGTPSWLYSVNHGATTMWEHWNSQKEDGSFWSTKMNSFNHYAYGAVFDWIFCVSSGITPRKPGYSEVDISPNPCKELGFADASIETRHGKIRVYWYYRDSHVHYEIEIPEGVKAYLKLAGYEERILTGGRYLFTV